MTAILIYVFPALMDMILSAVLFMSTVSAAQKGLSAGTVANLITTWAVVYMITSLLIGRIVSPRNAAKLIIFSCVMSVALSVSFALTANASIPVLYALVGLEGIAMSAFFVPFQVFMKSVDEGHRKTINHSVGLYTFSWSFGYALGPFLAGLFWQRFGWQGTHLIYAAAAVLVGVMMLVLKHGAPATPLDSQSGHDTPAGSPARGRAGSPEASKPAADYSRMPDLAWMGWVFSGLGCLAIRLVFGLFPSSAESFHLPEFEQGLTLFVLSAVQAGVGLILGYFHWWMYRPGPIFLAGACGVVSLGLFATAGSTLAFCLAAACFGVYAGMFFFYLVFHSLVHPDRSARYVSINEATVGMMSLAGPFLGGVVADHYSLRTSYLLAAGMLAVAVGIQAVIHALYLRSRPIAPAAPAEWVPAEVASHE